MLEYTKTIFPRTKMQNRNSGVLLHISSLPGEYSVGSFGKEARAFVDTLAAAGFSIWQVLPLSMTDECNSPYKSPASLGGNPYFIDLEELYFEGLLTLGELESAKGEIEYAAEFDRLACERIPLLKLAAERVLDRTPVIEFCDNHPELSEVAYFLALREANGGAPWQRWQRAECDIDELFAWQFIEYKFYTQWQSLKAYANSRGISIIGDLPIYVALDSADVWADPASFKLDGSGYPLEVAGVPPDYFSADGQLWGNPLYDWERMKADGYRFWKRRLSLAGEMYDGIRIDHFRAIESYWAVPVSAKSATAGKWVKGPGRSFIRFIKSLLPEKLIIAEDLGDITDKVRRLVDYSGFPGMRVLQFAFLGDPHSIHLPHNVTEQTIVYSGTHDNNTLLGYIWGLEGTLRARLFEYIGLSPEAKWESAAQRIIKVLMQTPARSVILPVQDLLGFGADTRMNTPGVAEGNWSYRLTREALGSFDVEKYKLLNELYER